MRWAPRRTPKRSPIGLDVGSRLVKAVQLAGGPGQWRVAAAVVAPRSGAGVTRAVLTPDEVGRIEQMLDRSGFDGRRVVLAAPAASLVQSVLDLPARSAAVPLERLARAELARAHRFAPDAFEMGCWEIPVAHRGSVGGRGTQAMAVALTHDRAAALLDPFDGSGLDVAAVDLPQCALTRACAAALPAAGGVTATLDLGWGAATLSLVRNGTVVYHRPLSDGGIGDLHAKVVRRLGLDAEVAEYLLGGQQSAAPTAVTGGAADAAEASDSENEANYPASGATGEADGTGERRRGRRASDRIRDDDAGGLDLPPDARALLGAHAEELTRELQVSFSYAAHQYADSPVGRLLLTGGGADTPGLARQLASALGIEVRRVSPADLVTCEPGLGPVPRSPVLTGALGLAMYDGEVA